MATTPFEDRHLRWLKDRKLRFLEERRLRRLEAKVLCLLASSEAVLESRRRRDGPKIGYADGPHAVSATFLLHIAGLYYKLLHCS